MFKTISKKLLVVLGLILLIGAACGTETDDTGTNEEDANQDSLTIGVSQATLRHQFFIEIDEGMQEIAEQEGINLLVTDSDLDLTGQVSSIEDFITQGVDAIIVLAVENTGLVPIVEEAAAAGIPVIAVDATIDSEGVTTFVGTENYEAGKIMGEDLRKQVEAAGEEVEIALVTHVESAIQRERLEGFKDAFEGMDLATILNEQPGYDREESMTTVENILQSNPEVDYIYATAENSVLGALAALEANNITNTKIVGFDVTEEAAEGIRNGYIISMIQQQPREMGVESIKAALSTLAGEELPEHVEVPIILINSENVDDHF